MSWHTLRQGFAEVCETFLHLLAPRCCCICGQGLEETVGLHRFVCRPCWDNLPLAPPPEKLYNELIDQFPGDELALSGAAALFGLREGTPPMRLIYALKYRRCWELGSELGRVLGTVLPKLLPYQLDVLIPVPIHPARRRERGYNQAEVIAAGISDTTGIPLYRNALRRRIATASQTQLTAEQRRLNVAGAFAGSAQAAAMRSANLLLVDDVITTGSTLNSCAEALLSLGAQRVFAVAIARAL
ncbi:MAG: phosphoribosyltransferase family protein [Candidatus Kapabacteria bacterium]|nr:phosphoribosyltransferase family protein [Candidatus Kapabacteria bacterium]MCS7169508.1 phosphoribosyltransferase family protein [Candidatus Kapabacteria bacterium]MDW7997522.1 phosphoribosyltransferase family protein [Bacteroidota bacterium]MDW8224794.1 phosphoribosyltransferase family protein [Bacteroidota bacterium]